MNHLTSMVSRRICPADACPSGAVQCECIAVIALGALTSSAAFLLVSYRLLYLLKYVPDRPGSLALSRLQAGFVAVLLRFGFGCDRAGCCRVCQKMPALA
jgi:hypothetical protein